MRFFDTRKLTRVSNGINYTMFTIGSIQSRLLSTLVILCYLVLAGASAVHQVVHTHGVEEVTCVQTPSQNLEALQEITTHSDCDATISLPCFLCIVGHPLSPVAESPAFLCRVPDNVLQTIREDADRQSAPHQLPSLRAPPSFS